MLFALHAAAAGGDVYFAVRLYHDGCDACYCIDRAINWIYDVLLVRLTSFFSQSLKNFNTGDVAGYMVRSFIGLAFLVLLFVLLI